jgi:replicative DNA helicase
MNDNNITHMNLSRALLACVLDFPAYLDAPDVAKVLPEDLHPSFAEAWSKARRLHDVNNLSVATLSAALPPSFSIAYLNELRAEHSNVSFDDLKGIAGSLRSHAQKRSLLELGKDIVNLSSYGRDADDIARDAIKRLTPIALNNGHTFSPLKDALSDVYEEIQTRSHNPGDVWGIPYKYYPRLSTITGGKQKGELTIFAGEPAVGKSWWTIQDAMGAAIDGTPTALWSGEMKRQQVARRMLQLQGLHGRRSKTGYMEADDWNALNSGIETLENIPFYQDDKPLQIHDVRAVLTRLKAEFGVEYVVLDYAYLIGAKGKDEIERTGMVSQEIKNVITDLDLACTLITSVNKGGMDTTSAGKASVRGSGQQLHDSDNVFLLTKFARVEDDPNDLLIKPDMEPQFSTLHIHKGREMEEHIPGGCIHYRRENSPKFTEWVAAGNEPGRMGR